MKELMEHPGLIRWEQFFMEVVCSTTFLVRDNDRVFLRILRHLGVETILLLDFFAGGGARAG